MGYSIELYFDSNFEEKINWLWETLSKAGFPSIFSKIGSRPHVSLAVLNQCNENQLNTLLKEFISSFTAFSIEFSAIALFPGKQQTVFLAPVGNKSLFDMHERLIRFLQDNGNPPSERYEPDKWLPHCSLSKELSAEEALKTIEICQHSNLLGHARVVSLGFIEFRPKRLIQTYSFKEED